MPSKLTALGALLGSFGIVVASTTTLLIALSGNRPPGIEEKIRELNEIKAALSTLISYVDTQQSRLRELSKEKVELEKEREKILRILEIDKEKLDSLREYQLTQERSRVWMDSVLSFFPGALSSSVVTFVAIRRQERKS